MDLARTKSCSRESQRMFSLWPFKQSRQVGAWKSSTAKDTEMNRLNNWIRLFKNRTEISDLSIFTEKWSIHIIRNRFGGSKSHISTYLHIYICGTPARQCWDQVPVAGARRAVSPPQPSLVQPAGGRNCIFIRMLQVSLVKSPATPSSF